MHLRHLSLALFIAALATQARADDRGCLAMIAYAEAAGEGDAGMAAVIQVVHNRVADARFPGSACAVIAQPGQFQPVSMSPRLAAALLDRNVDPASALHVDSAPERVRLDRALELSGRRGGIDPTDGAIYFVNPAIMDPARCSWFSALRRTKAIGAHVFLTHYRDGEARQGPAIDCAAAGSGFRAWRRIWAQGPLATGGPKIATITPTPAMLRTWRATGRLDARQRELRRRIGAAFTARD